MKKLLFLPFVLIVVAVLAIGWIYANSQPPSTNKDYKNFLIDKGSSASSIGTKLQKAGFIKSALAFKIYLQFTGRASSLQTGEFRLSPSFNLFQTVDALFKGPIEIWVTIPEGLRREEIAVKFASSLDKDSTFISEFLDASKNSEGTLFPDTYLFPKDVTATQVVNKMNKQFDSKTSGFTPTSGLNFDQSVVLASILERETKTDAERPIVAGILINRLNAGMPLQADAAVQYATGTSRCKGRLIGCEWWIAPTLIDLDINSPYNTYKFTGLPPGPISNPGESSLKAAFNPTKTDYWYYIHDPQGNIHYAKTLAEHNANVAKYLGK